MKPHEVGSPNGTRVDEYYWLRDDTRADPEVLAYLQAENAYKDAMLAGLRPLEDRLFAEIVGRIKQDDSTVPYRERGYWYYRRFDAGEEYPVHARRCGSLDSPEEVLLDLDELARGRDFYDVAEFGGEPGQPPARVCRGHRGPPAVHAAVQGPGHGRGLAGCHPERGGGRGLAADNRTVLYIEKDPERCSATGCAGTCSAPTLRRTRSCTRKRTTAYYTDVGQSKDGRYLYIFSHSTVTSEQRYADAADPSLEFRVLVPRERDHEYQADHCDGRWIIRTNWHAPNFRLVEAPTGSPADRGRWQDLIAHRDDAFIHGFDVFRDFVAVEERSGGLRKVRIRRWSGGDDLYLASDEPAYRAGLGDNEEFDSSIVRYTCTSLTDTGHDVRLRHAHGTAHAAEAGARARRFRPGALRHRVPVGAGARRRAGAGGGGLPEGLSQGTALRHCCSTPTEPMACPPIRGSRPRCSRSSTGVSSTPLRRCGEDRNSAVAGTTRAGC